MKIRTQLLLAFIGVATFSGIIGFIAYNSLNDINENFDKIISNTSEEIGALQDIKTNGFRAQMEMLSFVAVGEEETEGSVLEGEEDEFSEAIEAAEEAIERYEKFSDKNSEGNIQKLREYIDRYSEVGKKIIELKEEEEEEEEEENEEIFEELEAFEDIEDDFIEFTDELFKKEIGKLSNQKKSAAKVFNFSTGLIILMSLLAIVFSIALGYFISRLISLPLEKLNKSAGKLATGEFEKVNVKASGEVSELVKTYNQMLDNLEEAKELEEKNNKLELSNVALQAKNNALDTFVYRVSHDLKAPTLNISMLVKMLQVRLKNDDKIIQKTLVHLKKSSDKLNEAILDLLEVSRIDRNLKIQKEVIVFQDILDEVLAENKSLIEQNQPTVNQDFATQDIYFGKANVKSILANLVTNAIKYRSEDRPSEVFISTKEVEGGVELIVKDNGLGFDVEMNKDKLFKMFSRFHDHVEGSGVGMYIVNKIVTESGGTLNVESEVGKGTTFKVFLNLEEETNA